MRARRSPLQLFLHRSCVPSRDEPEEVADGLEARERAQGQPSVHTINKRQMVGIVTRAHPGRGVSVVLQNLVVTKKLEEGECRECGCDVAQELDVFLGFLELDVQVPETKEGRAAAA